MATTTTKQKTTTEELAAQDLKTQADEITRILAHTCDLLDALIASDRFPMDDVAPIIERMKAYLDRRGPVSEDPAWIVKMRRTVKAYTARTDSDAFSID